MEANLISRVHDEFKDMTFNQKIIFLKDYKQTVELIPLHIKHYIETKHNGFKSKLVQELVDLAPNDDMKGARSYYNKISTTNFYNSFDLKFVILLAKILDNKELMEKTYKMIVFAQKQVLWRDCAILGLTKNHFKFYWISHPEKSSIKRIIRFNESWIQNIDVLCDIYTFLQHIVSFNSAFTPIFKSLIAVDNKVISDYEIDGIHLDPEKFNITL
jgi:hypothetical protein